MQAWQWIKDEGNRGALSLLGAAFATVVAAGWAVFIYFDSKTLPSTAKPSPDLVKISPSGSGTASAPMEGPFAKSPGDVAVDERHLASVVTQKTGTADGAGHKAASSAAYALSKRAAEVHARNELKDASDTRRFAFALQGAASDPAEIAFTSGLEEADRNQVLISLSAENRNAADVKPDLHVYVSNVTVNERVGYYGCPLALVATLSYSVERSTAGAGTSTEVLGGGACIAGDKKAARMSAIGNAAIELRNVLRRLR